MKKEFERIWRMSVPTVGTLATGTWLHVADVPMTTDGASNFEPKFRTDRHGNLDFDWPTITVGFGHGIYPSQPNTWQLWQWSTVVS